jgi:hypothetical protein
MVPPDSAHRVSALALIRASGSPGERPRSSTHRPSHHHLAPLSAWRGATVAPTKSRGSVAAYNSTEVCSTQSELAQRGSDRRAVADAVAVNGHPGLDRWSAATAPSVRQRGVANTACSSVTPEATAPYRSSSSMAALNLAQQLSSSNPAAMRSGSPESVGDARPTWSVLASGTPPHFSRSRGHRENGDALPCRRAAAVAGVIIGASDVRPPPTRPVAPLWIVCEVVRSRRSGPGLSG